MMYDPAPRRDPSGASEWIMAGVFLAIFVGLIVADILQNYHPAKLSALLVVLFWIPLLALHEGGHALVAYLFGWHVKQIVVGMGKILGRFRIGRARVEVRLFPVEGFVTCAPIKIRLPQLESALIYFAGPGVELLLAVGVLIVVGPDRLFQASEEYGVIVWQSLALAAAAQAVLNLLPFAVKTPEGILHSDGLGILLSFFRPPGYYEEMAGQEYDPADWWKRNRASE
jgi:hypothetical protein